MTKKHRYPHKRGASTKRPGAAGKGRKLTPTGLTERQEKFCHEYMIDGNATQAAIRAGYSPHTAKRQGCGNVSKGPIQARIQQLRDAAGATLDQAAAEVRTALELAQPIAEANIVDIIEVTDDGRMFVKDLRALPRHITAAIQSVKIRREQREGEDQPAVDIIEVKLHPTLQAIDIVAKLKGEYAAQRFEGQFRGDVNFEPRPVALPDRK